MKSYLIGTWPLLFQHTATRRWLIDEASAIADKVWVSTHSHAKVAETIFGHAEVLDTVSTHSHAKVAETIFGHAEVLDTVSTHSHAKVAERAAWQSGCFLSLFQHTATRRWLRNHAHETRQPQRFNTQPREGG